MIANLEIKVSGDSDFSKREIKQWIEDIFGRKSAIPVENVDEI